MIIHAHIIAMKTTLTLKGKEMINFLRAGNKMNIKKIEKYIP